MKGAFHPEEYTDLCSDPLGICGSDELIKNVLVSTHLPASPEWSKYKLSVLAHTLCFSEVFCYPSVVKEFVTVAYPVTRVAKGGKGRQRPRNSRHHSLVWILSLSPHLCTIECTHTVPSPYCNSHEFGSTE
jgi:hypothetical protein